MKQLTVSACSQLWSQTLGYAITSNRIGSSELKENAFMGPCLCKVLYFYQRRFIQVDYLYQSALAWKELTEYRYQLVYGYKKALYPINLTFSDEDYPHLAGFQYMKDISLPNYTSAKIVRRVLEGKITFKHIQKAAQYEEMIKPRLEALIHLKNSFDHDFNLYSFMPQMYPFITNIKADYLIASHTIIDSYVFTIRTTPKGDAKCDFLCCSAFTKGNRNYETNQRKRILLQKVRIHIPSNTTTILLNKLNTES